MVDVGSSDRVGGMTQNDLELPFLRAEMTTNTVLPRGTINPAMHQEDGSDGRMKAWPYWKRDDRFTIQRQYENEKKYAVKHDLYASLSHALSKDAYAHKQARKTMYRGHQG